MLWQNCHPPVIVAHASYFVYSAAPFPTNSIPVARSMWPEPHSHPPASQQQQALPCLAVDASATHGTRRVASPTSQLPEQAPSYTSCRISFLLSFDARLLKTASHTVLHAACDRCRVLNSHQEGDRCADPPRGGLWAQLAGGFEAAGRNVSACGSPLYQFPSEPPLLGSSQGHSGYCDRGIPPVQHSTAQHSVARNMLTSPLAGGTIACR